MSTPVKPGVYKFWGGYLNVIDMTKFTLTPAQIGEQPLLSPMNDQERARLIDSLRVDFKTPI